jgi:hypothetical protein
MLIRMGLDDTYTDLEFKQRIAEANRDWIKQFAEREPDLAVEAFTGSMFTRLLRLFSSNKS